MFMHHQRIQKAPYANLQHLQRWTKATLVKPILDCPKWSGRVCGVLIIVPETQKRAGPHYIPHLESHSASSFVVYHRL